MSNALFLTLSAIAVCIWGSIIFYNQTIISKLNLTDMTDAANSEIFFFVAFRMQIYIQMCGIVYVLLFFKLLKYLGTWIKRVTIIFNTLERAQSDIFYFLIMYMVIFCAFVVMTHIYYGSALAAFGSVPDTMKTLFLMILGNLSSLDDMVALNSGLSFFFFLSFTTSMQFILLNMFVAFITRSYFDVNSEMKSTVSDNLQMKHWLVYIIEFKDYLIKRFAFLNKRFGPRKPPPERPSRPRRAPAESKPKEREEEKVENSGLKSVADPFGLQRAAKYKVKEEEAEEEPENWAKNAMLVVAENPLDIAELEGESETQKAAAKKAELEKAKKVLESGDWDKAFD